MTAPTGYPSQTPPDVTDLVDEAPDITDSSWARPLHRLRGYVSLQGVSTSYGDGRLALRNVDLTVQAGQRVGVTVIEQLHFRFVEQVGRLGAGKGHRCTLRFWVPNG